MEHWNFWEMIIRATGIFILLLLMTRLMGRKQMSQLTFFNYVTGIALGSIAANTTIGPSKDLLNGITSLIWWSILTIIIGFFSLKSSNVRIAVDGQPITIIKRGNILENELRKLRLNMDDVSMWLREQQIFSVQNVDHAVFEANGKLSISLKEEIQPVTKKDQHIFTIQPTYIPMELISDGKIVEKNLKEAGISIEWLHKQLQLSKLKLEDVFYAELQKDGTLYINKRKDRPKNNNGDS